MNERTEEQRTASEVRLASSSISWAIPETFTDARIWVPVALFALWLGYVLYATSHAQATIFGYLASTPFLVVIGIGLYIYMTMFTVRATQRARMRRIAEAQRLLKDAPEKARPAWELATVTLEAYFARNLSQINSIFVLSIAVMLAGFGLVVWSALLVQGPGTTMSECIRIATTISGVLTQFIGATFLFVYRSTIQQAMSYTSTLERINSAGMAMQILDTIPEDAGSPSLKSRAKATLIPLLIHQSFEKPE